jgi:D-beta-D-heptose 7-phosphate kinase / D-beta-D-heptose 1-phosphate adenosyltransferase
MVGQIERWREGGLRIGFTNGVFDILHPGHVRVLEESRSRCDRLVVGLNSDASVKRLKGAERPVNSEQSRAQVLCGLAAVDGVVIFEEDTPLNLITALKPDVLVKGGDYTRDTIVGADLVEARGGEVFVVPLVPGQSTTSIIARSRGGA